MPLVAMAEENSYSTAKELTTQLIDILLKSQYALKDKINVLV